MLLWGEGTVDELRDVVGQSSSDALLASAAPATTLALWLPADGNTLVAQDRAALSFSPAEAIDLLVSLPQPVPANVFGDSVRYWTALARFVVERLRRERFLPAVRRANAHHEAFWRLHVSAADEIERLERFAAAMPPSCRALVTDAADVSPLGLIESFMTATADALIRRAASADPFFTRVIAMGAEKGAGPEVRLLSGLMGMSPTVPGEPRENDVLVDQVQLWTSRLGGAAPATGWQLGFILREPPDDDSENDSAPWRVELQLVPLGEGKPIEAEKIWADASPLTALGRQQPELRAVMTAEMQRAAEVFPPIERTVAATPTPSFIELSPNEAVQFLRQWSAELRAHSFAVELPAWAEESQRRMTLVMALRPSDGTGDTRSEGLGERIGEGPSRMGLDSLLEFDWRVSLGGGGAELSPDEFESLVARQTPLVKVRGQWVELDADAAAAARELMESRAAGKTTLGDAFRAAFATTRLANAPAVALSGTSWV